jgi:hypothetical protein
MAGMAAMWAARVGSIEGDWAQVMLATEKRAAARVAYRIPFIDIGSILRGGSLQLWVYPCEMAHSFSEQLRRQLRFLELSSKAYDEGFSDEAIRIATSVRVLIHETKRQTPLIRHMNASNIRLASVVRGASPTAVFYTGMGRIETSSLGAKYYARTSPEVIKCYLPVNEWWTQVVYIQGSVKLSRRDIVLAAADKDGGAHVDAKLTPEYEALMNEGGQSFWSITDPTTGKFTPIIDAHLVYLREVGLEVLNSPELINLARLSPALNPKCDSEVG